MRRFPKRLTRKFKGSPESEKQAIAAYLGGKKMGVTEAGDAKTMPNRCATNAPLGDIAAAMWRRLGRRRDDKRTLSTRERGTGLSDAQVP